MRAMSLLPKLRWSFLGCAVLLLLGLLHVPAYGKGGVQPSDKKELQEVKAASTVMLGLQTVEMLIKRGRTEAAAGKLTATENQLNAFVTSRQISTETRDSLLVQIEDLKTLLAQ